MTQIKITYKIIVGAYCIRPENEFIANIVGAGPVSARDKSPKKEGVNKNEKTKRYYVNCINNNDDCSL